MVIYTVQVLLWKYNILCCSIITPAVAKQPCKHLKALEGIISNHLLHLGRERQLKRDNYGQIALSRGICTGGGFWIHDPLITSWGHEPLHHSAPTAQT